MATLYKQKNCFFREPPNPCVSLSLNVNFVKYFISTILPDDNMKVPWKCQSLAIIVFAAYWLWISQSELRRFFFEIISGKFGE